MLMRHALVAALWVVLVRVIRCVVGGPGGRGVLVPASSTASPAVRWSVVLRVIVVGVRRVMVVFSIVI